jgi:hypothetical protein
MLRGKNRILDIGPRVLFTGLPREWLLEKNPELGLRTLEVIFEELAQGHAAKLIASDGWLIAETAPFLAAGDGAAAG